MSNFDEISQTGVISIFFRMVASAILNFENFDILTVRRVKRVKLSLYKIS